MRFSKFTKIFLITSIFLITLSSCNFPGLESSTEAVELPTSSVQESTVAPKPTQPVAGPPTRSPEEQPPEASEGEPFLLAKGIVYCLETPYIGSESAFEFSPGERAPVLGITPNQNWIAANPKDAPRPCWVIAAEVELSVDPGSLEVLQPPATATPALGSIAGVLWHEICEFSGGQAGEPVVLGQGCVQWGVEAHEFGPNQLQDPFEGGWEGVTLHLGAGPCPSTGLATTVTDVNGEYVFTGLSAGIYCVSYTSLGDGNDLILIPGGPTYPERGEDGFYQTIDLDQGENAIGVDFGYAFQFYN